MGMLEDKVAVVTGAGRGIGRAEALRFAEEGCRVVVDDTGVAPNGDAPDPSVAEAVVREIEAKGGVALATRHDVGAKGGADALVEEAVARFGKVDILVTNAAIIRDTKLLDLEDDAWDVSMTVTLRGTFAAVRAVARHLVRRGAPGSILTTTSLAGLVGTKGLPSYSAAKAGIYGLTCTAALELKEHGIRVNTLSPIAYTRLTAEPMKQVPDAEAHFSPSYVADVAAFLVSDAAAEITGTVVDVQGQQVSVYRMIQGTGVLPRAGGRWTKDELRERWTEIANISRVKTLDDAAALRTDPGG